MSDPYPLHTELWVISQQDSGEVLDFSDGKYILFNLNGIYAASPEDCIPAHLVDYHSLGTWTDEQGKTRPHFLVTELSDMRVFSVYDSVFEDPHNVTLNLMTMHFRCTCWKLRTECEHIEQVQRALGIDKPWHKGEQP